MTIPQESGRDIMSAFEDVRRRVGPNEMLIGPGE